MIFASFVLSIVSAEMNPPRGEEHLGENKALAGIFKILDDVITGFFATELLINMAAHWFPMRSYIPTFFYDPWHVFDLVSTSASIISALEADVPAFHPLRALRVLRVIRLVGKEGSLKAIVEALLMSIVPVLNSIMLLGLVTCIFAIVGVGLFADQDPILFGTFSQSFFTMFQSCTGDGWASGVARTMFHESGKVKALPAVFFILYMLICYLMLVNIVVAVLLDEFLTTMTNNRSAQRISKVLGSEPQKSPLEPLLAVLAANLKSDEDLSMSIGGFFRRLDVDMNGSLGFHEFADGLKTLANVYLSREGRSLLPL